MSICFDFTELLLLLEYSVVELLSQNILSGLSIVSTMRSPVTKFRSHIPWLDASKHAINSAAMVEEAMSVCLALFQEIGPPASM